MADPNRNKGIDDLISESPKDKKPASKGASSSNAPATPPATDSSATRPGGVDVGGIPRSPTTSAPPDRPAGAPKKPGSPPTTSNVPAAMPNKADGALADRPGTSSRPPVDTGGVGTPLQAADEAPPATSEGSNLPANQQTDDGLPDTPANADTDPAAQPGGIGAAGPRESSEGDAGEGSGNLEVTSDEGAEAEETEEAEQAEEVSQEDRGKQVAQQLEQRFQGAGAAELEGAAAKQAGRAATTAMAPYAIPLAVGCLVLFFFFIFVGLAVAGIAGSGGGKKDGEAGGSEVSSSCGDQLSGTPKEIIDKQVIPLAHEIDFKHVTPSSVDAANARHGTTVTGGRSDHQGPPDVAWAADISNGQSPTPEMDKLADKLADCYGMRWSGSGVVSSNKNGYRIQMLYRTNVGGNHFNHVHIGIRKGG